MSTQAFGIDWYWFKISKNDLLSLPRFSNLTEQNYYDFFELSWLEKGYYDFRQEAKNNDRNKTKSCVSVIFGGYSDEIFIWIVTKVWYIENTHWDDRWTSYFRDDDWVKNNAKRIINTVFWIDKEPLEFRWEEFWW